MRDITLPVWQFVRLMVKIEETQEKFRDVALRALYADWEEFWADLDARLIDAGNRSRDDFANIMMYQEVVMHRMDKTQIALIKREFEALIKILQRLASEAKLKEDKRNLNYEWQEITLFIKNLPQD